SAGSLLTTNSLEPLLWMGCAYFAILAIKRDGRYWLAFGLIAGLGLEEKYSIAIFGLGIVIGLLVTKHRRVLIGKWFWMAGGLAFLIFLPNIIWKIRNHWPFLELTHHHPLSHRHVELTPLPSFMQPAFVSPP